jgi:hypothetical protein
MPTYGAGTLGGAMISILHRAHSHPACCLSCRQPRPLIGWPRPPVLRPVARRAKTVESNNWAVTNHSSEDSNGVCQHRWQLGRFRTWLSASYSTVTRNPGALTAQYEADPDQTAAAQAAITRRTWTPGDWQTRRICTG